MEVELLTTRSHLISKQPKQTLSVPFFRFIIVCSKTVVETNSGFFSDIKFWKCLLYILNSFLRVLRDRMCCFLRLVISIYSECASFRRKGCQDSMNLWSVDSAVMSIQLSCFDSVHYRDILTFLFWPPQASDIK